MFSYQWKKSFLADYFKQQNDLKSVTIATAYFSEYGFNLLQDLVELNQLSSKKVTLYLGNEFTDIKIAEILKKLNKIATVYIVDKMPLHAKVYLFEKAKGKYEMIHGSANFTKGGFERNLEFFTLQQGEDVDVNKLNYFFDFCKNNAVFADSSIIDYYEAIEDDLRKLRKIQQEIRKNMKQRITLDDGFQEDDYDLTDSYFSYEDFETLFRRNEQLKTEDLKQRRERIRNKLLTIDRLIRSYINDWDLHPHWNTQNITSGTEPNVFNHHRVSWMGVRYGKTEHEVKQLNSSPIWDRRDKDEQIGFQKHSCIQFCLVPNGFEILLFHAVAKGAVDRGYLHDLIHFNKKAELQRITKAIAKLKGKGFVWSISDPNKRSLVAKFDIDNETPENFIEFYKKYDKEGYVSVCEYSIEPDNQILKDKKEIAKLILRKTKQLLPLYRSVTLREQYKI